MAKKKKPWADTWSFVDDLGSGGQGATSLVKRKNGTLGVLKILHKQNDPERRARMWREARTLKTLEHPQIPRLLDTNAGEFKGDAKLYLVTEFIAGRTLGEVVSERRPTLDEAFELTISLCGTLAYTHERGVSHRDIKPENVVLRGSSFGDPVLIDFGISFNATDPDDKLTDESQHLGNRFIDLPELKRGPLKRDLRPDLTQVVGVLFFAVTGEAPTMLRDAEEERLPHQLPDVKQMLDQIEPEGRRRQLRRLFNRGFQYRIGRRWQSIQALRSALEDSDQVMEEPEDVADVEEKISAELAAGDPGYRDRVTFTNAYEAIMLAIYGVVLDLTRQLDRFRTTKFAPGPDFESFSFRYGAGLHPEGKPDVVFEATFVARVMGNEIVISREDGDRETELSCVPFVSNPDLSDLKEQLIPFYRNGIYHQVKST